MENIIDSPAISEILLEEFMQPLGISVYKLAKDINVPVSRIQNILKDKRKITVDISLRLARHFNVSYKYFLSLQNDIDIRNALMAMCDELDKIKRCGE